MEAKEVHVVETTLVEGLVVDGVVRQGVPMKEALGVHESIELVVVQQELKLEEQVVHIGERQGVEPKSLVAWYYSQESSWQML